MTIHVKDSAVDQILRGEPTIRLVDGETKIMAPSYGFEGSPDCCGKDGCREKPTHFAAALSHGVARFLCANHAERWFAKSKELIKNPSMKSFYYYCQIMRCGEDILLENITAIEVVPKEIKYEDKTFILS